MADISVTAANVRPYSGATTKQVTAGGTVTAGDLVYKDLTDSNEYKRCANTALASTVVAGIALTNAGDGEPLIIQTAGYVNPGGTVVVGASYVVATNAGKIAPIGDNTSATDYVGAFGWGITSSKILIAITITGVQTP